MPVVLHTLAVLFVSWIALYPARVFAEVNVSESVMAPLAPAANASVVVVVVLVGETGRNHELTALLFELLEREGVHPLFEREALFEPNTLLGEADTDAGVRVYIAFSPTASVRLYFRGPFGRRFILRELLLPGGLNEVGRESIAQVVATSTVALFDSSTLAGIDRETAKATLARRAKEEVAPAPAQIATPKRQAPPAPLQTPLRRAFVKNELGVRGVTRWTGTPSDPNFGIGAEGGLILWPSGWFFHRERVVGEYLGPQTIAAPELDLSVSTFALRGGVDLAISRGAHALMAGLSAGIDVFWISPKHLRNDEFSPRKSTGVIPLIRTELRYELSLSSLLVAAAAFADIALRGIHYDIDEGEVLRTIDEPWLIRPGFSLTLAWQPMFYK